MKPMNLLMVILLVVSLLLANAGTVRAASAMYVNTTVDQNGAGPECSLREAIMAVNRASSYGGCPSGAGVSQIILNPGSYKIEISGPKENDGLTGDLDIRFSIEIVGSGRSTTVYASQNLGDRIFHVMTPAGNPKTRVTMKNFTIDNGFSAEPSGGGGIFNDGATLVLNGMIVSSNDSSSVGGGVTNNVNSELTIDRSVFNQNTSGSGGAIQNAGKMVVRNSLFVGNSASRTGGAIDHRPSYLDGVTGEIINTTIALNSSLGDASGGGAGVAVSQGKMVITHTTIARNTGIGVLVNANGDLTMRNSIIAFHPSYTNCKRLGAGKFTSQGYNLVDTSGSLECVFAGTDILNQESYLSAKPTVEDSPNGVFTFTSTSSPAIDVIPVGNPYVPKYDQLLHGRPGDGNQDSVMGFDMGAFELGGPANSGSIYLPFLIRR